MQTAVKFVIIIVLMMVVTIVIIGLLMVWTGQASDIATGIVNFFKGADVSNLDDFLNP